jgi:hypothetical protein
MANPAYDGQRIVEERFLLNVIEGRLAQRADDDIDIGIAQLVDQRRVGAIDYRDLDLGCRLRNCVMAVGTRSALA